MTSLRDPRSWTSFARRSWWALLLLAGIFLWLVGMAGWPNRAVSALVFIAGLALIVADGVLVGRASRG